MHRLPPIERLGLIAGNGQLPFLLLEEALARSIPVTVAAIKEETEPAIEQLADASGRVTVHWVGLGQLGKLLKVFRREQVDKAVMVGQVKHSRIFAPGSGSPFKQLKHLPDWRMARLLSSLEKKDTGSLIGGVIGVLEEAGISLLDSTLLLQRLIPEVGPLTRRALSEDEQKNVDYGRPLAQQIARMDLGQTIVVKDRAVVAIEAMEGTNQTIRRAAELVKGKSLTVIKVSRPAQDLRFDLPVVGLKTLDVLVECQVSALAVDAERTLILDRDRLVAGANAAEIAVVAFKPDEKGEKQQ